jgi:hypothetical protein
VTSNNTFMPHFVYGLAEIWATLSVFTWIEMNPDLRLRLFHISCELISEKAANVCCYTLVYLFYFRGSEFSCLEVTH